MKKPSDSYLEEVEDVEDLVNLTATPGTSVDFWDRMENPFDISNRRNNPHTGWIATRKDISRFDNFNFRDHRFYRGDAILINDLLKNEAPRLISQPTFKSLLTVKKAA